MGKTYMVRTSERLTTFLKQGLGPFLRCLLTAQHGWPQPC